MTKCKCKYIYIYILTGQPSITTLNYLKKIKINCSTTGILRTIHPTAPTSQTGSSYTHMSQAFPHYCCIYDHTTLYQSLYYTHIIPQQASGSSYEVSVPGGLSSCPAVDMGWGRSVLGKKDPLFSYCLWGDRQYRWFVTQRKGRGEWDTRSHGTGWLWR